MPVSRTQMARTFFRIGATAYGGPAIVAQIREVVVLEKKWVSEGEFAESLAFAQMLPGPVAVPTAAHLGWRLHGGAGTRSRLVAYVAPSFLLMLALSAAYFRFEGLPVVTKAFRGLGAAVVAIVAQSILSMAQPAIKNWQGLAIAAAPPSGSSPAPTRCSCSPPPRSPACWWGWPPAIGTEPAAGRAPARQRRPPVTAGPARHHRRGRWRSSSRCPRRASSPPSSRRSASTMAKINLRGVRRRLHGDRPDVPRGRPEPPTPGSPRRSSSTAWRSGRSRPVR